MAGKPPDEQLFQILFYQMIMSLNEAAMIQLGKLVNPTTGQTERNLAQAEGTIDLMRMLKAKSQGNLAPEEERMMDQTIMALQLNFVEEREKDAQPGSQPAEAAGGTPEEKTGETPAGEDDAGEMGQRPGMDN
ncbi:MAG: DUF1844 domain-containing protein [candidate division FCPU426 bacterium]